MKEHLKEAGLTENESKVYLALLEMGPTNAGLLSRKSGLHRRVVYDTADMLIKKGLIGYIMQNNVRLFQASNPNRFLELINERKAVVDEILPAMQGMYTKTKEKEWTNFYKGRNGLKTVFEDQLAVGQEILIMGASSLAYDVLEFYFKWFDQRRKKQRIKARIIFNKTEKKLAIPYADIRFLPAAYSSPVAVNIYGDKVAIILWSKDNPLAIVIKNRTIADGYRKHFELVWRIAKPATK